MAKDQYHGQAHREAHAVAIGKIVMAWNEYQEHLGELFGGIFGRRYYGLALSAWHSVPSDSTQRQMLRSVVEAKLKGKAREELLWLLNQTDQILASQRTWASTRL